MCSYAEYLKEKHPEYLKTKIGNHRVTSGRLQLPLAIENFHRKVEPIITSCHFFRPLKGYDALHEFAGMTIHPLMYLLRGVAEAAIEFSLTIEILFNVPIFLFPPCLAVLLLTSVVAASIDIFLGVAFAAAMLIKSTIGLSTGLVTTGVHAVVGESFFNDFLAL